MLNGAQWHLLINHFPIAGGLLATIVLGYGLVKRNDSIIRLGYGLFVLMSIPALHSMFFPTVPVHMQ